MRINRPFRNFASPGATSSPAEFDPMRTALVVIDMQNWDAHPDFGLARLVEREGIEDDGYWDRVEDQVVPNNVRLLALFREWGGRVVFTVPASYFADSADANPNCRRMFGEVEAVVGDRSCDIRSELRPQRGEAVVVKVGSGAWGTSGIDHVLRHAGVTTLLFAGVVSNGCVLLSALGASDHGYDIHVVEDAMTSFTRAHHEVALDVFSMYNFGIWSTAEVEAAIAPRLAGAVKV